MARSINGISTTASRINGAQRIKRGKQSRSVTRMYGAYIGSASGISGYGGVKQRRRGSALARISVASGNGAICYMHQTCAAWHQRHSVIIISLM